jgi:hypothetical protein
LAKIDKIKSGEDGDRISGSIAVSSFYDNMVCYSKKDEFEEAK